jgi:hypothetical protein
MKTSLLRPIDFLTLGLPSVLCAGLTIYLYADGAVTGEPLALLISVTAAFFAVYVGFLIYRYRFLSKISFTTRHKLHVITNGFEVTQSEIESITSSTLDSWAYVIAMQTKEDYHKRLSDSIEELFVIFREYPVRHPSLGKAAGYAIGDNIVVGFIDPVAESAFGHELGHYFYAELTGKFENAACHQFMKENGLR